MEVTDWRCVSQHHISELVENAVERHQFHIKFKPSVIIAAGDDALSVARILRATLKSKIGTGMPILTHNMDLYDEESNPYNPNLGYWGNNS
jgi:hypoxanthine phosphoribosyltransferase